jgi:hypothetical protein
MFKKLFCRHKWEVHSKKESEHKEIIRGTECWFVPQLEIIKDITEIFICSNCGKIEIIEY